MPAVPVAAGAAEVVAGAGELTGVVAGVLGAVPLLGPQSGLQVSPVTFQSIETEGRWKPERLVAPSSQSRIFELEGQVSRRPVSLTDPSTYQSQTPELWGPLTVYRRTLFTVECNPGGGRVGKFSVDASWWADGLEIWGGYAGLAHAEGFQSVVDNMASASLHAVPFGNYYPAEALIAWSGWLNPHPTGAFLEFRGAIRLGADGSTSASKHAGPTYSPATVAAAGGASSGTTPSPPPAYMEYWTREAGSNPTQAQWDVQSGFEVRGGDT